MPIPKRFILDGSIDDAKIAAGGNIASSKLADGANWIKRDGSVPMTGNFDVGSQKIVNLTTPSATGDAANKSYVDTIIGSLNSAYKYRVVRVASTANVTISNPGTAVFDGVTLSNGDLVLLKNQTAGAENGIYVFNGSSSAMTRNADSDAWNEIPGSLVDVLEGTVNASTRYKNTNSSTGTLGTTAITYSADNTGNLTAANFVDGETPAGTVNGSNVTFTLANTPVSGSVLLTIENAFMIPGSGNDYTITGATITFATAPLTGERIRANYRK